MSADDSTIEHFWTRGFMRLAGAFEPDAARTMRDAVWRELSHEGIDRDRPATWSIERPTRLQRLKDDRVFDAVGSAPVRNALNAIFDGRAHDLPENWGAFFIAFPTKEAWRIPNSGWHIDAHYGGALRPTGGVKTHALLDDVEPRGGGTLLLAGSHRLVHDWFKVHPAPPNARSAELRRLLQAHPYIRALHTEGEANARTIRFMARAETVGGVALQVVENVGRAGDVILVHPLVLHVAAPNNGSSPRFLLSGGVTVDGWGWGRLDR